MKMKKQQNQKISGKKLLLFSLVLLIIKYLLKGSIASDIVSVLVPIFAIIGILRIIQY